MIYTYIPPPVPAFFSAAFAIPVLRPLNDRPARDFATAARILAPSNSVRECVRRQRAPLVRKAGIAQVVGSGSAWRQLGKWLA